MTAARFDALKLAERLKTGGFSKQQATEAVADATSRKLAARADLEKLRIRIDHRLETREQRLVIQMGAMFVVAVGMVTALAKLV